MSFLRNAGLSFVCSGMFFGIGLMATPASAQTVRAMTASPIASLIPAHNSQNLILGLNRNIFETLTLSRPGRALEGVLATSWEPSEDRKSWIFKLRRGVMFSDGTPFNADAVVKTFNYLLTSTKPVPARGGLGPVTGAKAIDEYTVEIMVSRPFSGLPVWLSAPVAGIVSPKSLEQYGSEAGNRMSSGTGPLVYSQVQIPDRVVLKRNPNYWGEKAKLDTLDFRYVGDEQARISALLSGDADLNLSIDPQDVTRVNRSKGYEVVPFVTHRSYIMHFPMNVPELQDRKVREALNYAIDRKTIIEQIFKDQAVPMDSSIGPNQYGYKSVRSLPYDTNKATALLAEAGWKKDSSGVLTKDGKPFPTLRLLASLGRYTGDNVMAQAVAGYFNAVGVPVQLQILEYATFWADANSKENRGKLLVQIAWGFAAEGASMVCQTYAPTVGLNFGDYNNPKIAEYCSKVDMTFESDARLKLIEEMVTEAFNDFPALFIVSPNNAIAKRANLNGIYLNPVELHDYRNMEYTK